MTSRRQFLTQIAVAGSGLALPAGCSATEMPPSSAKSLRLLILGGTGNIGPHHVRGAVERGHRVSVFSRGRTAAQLPAGVEHLIGDRSGDLSSIRGRDWDAVVDIATFGAGWVRTLGEALKGHVGHYTFISTVSVYDDPAANKITDESSRVLAYHGSADPYSVTVEGVDYDALKVLCERESELQFPSRTLIVRPGYISGPDDTHAPLLYWLQRMQRGGEVLAAGDPSTPVQFIDVRDLADWTIRMVEKRESGVYIAVGPVPPADMATVIDAAARTTAPVKPMVTWVPRSWLSGWKDSEITRGLLFWEFNKGSLSGISNARALAHGLTTRSMDVTFADTWRWFKRQPPRAEIRIGYRQKPGGSWFEPIELSWQAYLEREKSYCPLGMRRREKERDDADRLGMPAR